MWSEFWGPQNRTPLIRPFELSEPPTLSNSDIPTGLFKELGRRPDLSGCRPFCHGSVSFDTPSRRNDRSDGAGRSKRCPRQGANDPFNAANSRTPAASATPPPPTPRQRAPIGSSLTLTHSMVKLDQHVLVLHRRALDRLDGARGPRQRAP